MTYTNTTLIFLGIWVSFLGVTLTLSKYYNKKRRPKSFVVRRGFLWSMFVLVPYIICILLVYSRNRNGLGQHNTSKKTNSPQSSVADLKYMHIVPTDIQIDVSEDHTDKYQSQLSVHALHAPLYFKREAKVLSFEFDDDYFAYTEYRKDITVNNVHISKDILYNTSESMEIEVFFETQFVYVDTYWLVNGVEAAVGRKVGFVTLEFPFEYAGKIHVQEVEIPIRFK